MFIFSRIQSGQVINVHRSWNFDTHRFGQSHSNLLINVTGDSLDVAQGAEEKKRTYCT